MDMIPSGQSYSWISRFAIEHVAARADLQTAQDFPHDIWQKMGDGRIFSNRNREGFRRQRRWIQARERRKSTARSRSGFRRRRSPRVAAGLPVCVESDLEIELRQWDAAILVDDTPFAFRPRPGLGVAVDLGTTTLVAQLLDLTTGKVLAVSTALNAQARYGADVMSRLHFAVLGGGQQQLQSLIRQQIGALIEQLLFSAGKQGAEIADMVVVGNTVMHHFFCGIAAEPLAHYPFEPAEEGMKTFRSGELGWKLAGEPKVRFLPCLGGFVGSDVLAGILAAKLMEHDDLVGLVDLGTNGEIVIGNKRGLAVRLYGRRSGL